jgi:tetratricopeptide (TPR) repeat protein
MMQQAQQMMANMSPEQIKNMQDMVASMPAEQRESMQRQAMAMGGAPPSVTPSGAASYEFNAAIMLKNEGNDLHKAGKHREAISKYERALRNLESHATVEAQNLKSICILNTAMCLLKLEDWTPCVQLCTKVLEGRFSSL